MERIASITRDTNETQISMSLNLDGSGRGNISTGIGFFDHMLNSFARHGFFDLDLTVKGDLEVDTHHTIEDTGIVLGQAIRKAVGDKRGLCAMAPKSCPWMNPWCSVPWTFAEGPTWSGTWFWTGKRWGIWRLRWCGNFFTRFPMGRR